MCQNDDEIGSGDLEKYSVVNIASSKTQVVDENFAQSLVPPMARLFESIKSLDKSAFSIGKD